jgi:HK97 family phage major capsid protein
MTDTDTRPQRARSSRQRERPGTGWYRITNLADGPAQILIYDEIGFWGITAQDFLRDLDGVSGPVEVRVNSPGGDVFDAYAIYNALASRPGVTTIVDSLAASAASVIVMAGERRLMARTSQLMIHDAWAVSDGNADDLRHMAARLDTVSEQIAGIYAATAGGGQETWREAMRAETWYTPEQALGAGLITGIAEPARAAAPEQPALEPAASAAGPGIRATAQNDPQAAARHEPIAGAHDHPHPAYGSQGGDVMHSHMHEHAMDASHDHAHSGSGTGGSGGDDGSQDCAAAAIRAHFGFTEEQAAALSQPERALLAASLPADEAATAVNAGVDDSPWDGNAAMTEASSADNPAAAFTSICAGEHNTGDRSQRQHWALPHHKHQGGPPNAGGVRNSLSQLPKTEDLKNKQAAQSHLEAHMKAVNPDWEPSDALPADQTPEGSDPADAPAAGSGQPQAAADAPAAAAPQSPPAPAASAARPAAQATDTTTSRTGPRQHPDGHRRNKEGKTVTTTMSIEDRVRRRDEIEARLTAIGDEHGDGEFPEPIQAEWDQLEAELDEHERALARHEEGLNRRRERLAAIAGRQQGERVNGEESGYAGTGEAPEGEAAAANGNGHVPPAARGPRNRAAGSPGLGRGRTDVSIYDLDDLRKRSRSAEEMAALCRDNALRAVERATFPGSDSRERAQTTVERLLARVDDDNGTLAKRILVTGNPLYMRAWSRAVARLSTSVLTQEEIRALAVGVGADGGFAVPFELDPTVILTSDGAINPLRQLSRVQQITGKEYDLVTSAGVTVTRSGEGTPVDDNSPTLAQPTIKAERVTGFIPFSVEIEQDWQAMQNEMMMLLADAKDVEEASSFTNGDGTAPNAGGIAATLPSGSHVAGTGGAGALAAGDLDALEDDSAPRFRSRAVWMASKTVYNAYRALLAQQASSAGDDWARPSAGQPRQLRGYDSYENSEMGTTHATGDKPIIFGDFGRGFLIVDRLGMSTELVPHLVDATTARPTGERGLLSIWRNNSMVLIPNAFRQLVVG